jgi:hypothetical protein
MTFNFRLSTFRLSRLSDFPDFQTFRLIPHENCLLIYGEKSKVSYGGKVYPIKPIAYKDKYYKRILNSNHKMSLTEVANEHLRTISGGWDYYVDPNHSLEHISIEKIVNSHYKIFNSITEQKSENEDRSCIK